MAYFLAYWTGLRRWELETLDWRDLRLQAAVPYVQLRGEVGKAGRDDIAPLHQQIVSELLAFKPADAKPTDRVLPEVPSIKVMKAD